MIITTYKCDACNNTCEPESITTIASFPRRTYKYARDLIGTKICGFPDIAFEETHFCSACLTKLLNWTNVVEEK